jgi:hypothetical protein
MPQPTYIYIVDVYFSDGPPIRFKGHFVDTFEAAAQAAADYPEAVKVTATYAQPGAPA